MCLSNWVLSPNQLGVFCLFLRGGVVWFLFVGFIYLFLVIFSAFLFSIMKISPYPQSCTYSSIMQLTTGKPESADGSPHSPPRPQLQNLIFSQWIGVQYLLFSQKFTSVQPGNQHICLPAMAKLVCICFWFSCLYLLGLQCMILACLSIAEWRWCTIKSS